MAKTLEKTQASKETKTSKMLIGGKWVAGKGPVRVIYNPATEEAVGETYDAGEAEVNAAVEAAQAAFEDGRWSGLAPAQRASFLFKLADLIEKEQAKLAELESDNCGKPMKLAAEGDLPFAVDNLRFFASACRTAEGKAAMEYAGGYTSFLRREPLGVVGLIAPWNYPFMMAIWKMGPALAAGNTVVFKPSELTPLTALELGRLVEAAGFPEGVVNIVTGAEETGRLLTQHPGVAMVSFTGDTETGKKILAQVAPTVKRSHMELGGKAPFVVFEDADLDAAVQGAAVGGLQNVGQDCTAATRLYVQESIYKKFADALKAELGKVRVGSPRDPKTDMGPLISRAQMERVEGFVVRAEAEGGRVLCGGRRHNKSGKGFYFQPTLIEGVKQESEIVQKEVFGPVMVLLPFKDEADAVKKANGVPYGLAGSVWTCNVQRALRVSAALRFGTVWINDHLPLCSEMPHGGFKQSGFGKDMSAYALDEFSEVKHVMADLSGQARKGWHYLAYGDK